MSFVYWTTVTHHPCPHCDRAQGPNEGVAVISLPRTLILCHRCFRDLQREMFRPFHDTLRQMFEASVDEGEEPPQISTAITHLDFYLMADLGWKLPYRVYNALKFGGDIETLRDLVTKTPNELLRMRNFGKKALHVVQTHLAESGLRLGLLPREVELLDKYATDLQLSVRADNTMQKLHCKFVSDVVALTEKQVKKAARGTRVVKEINEALAPYFALRKDEP